MTREHDISLTYLQSLLEDVFNLLEVGLLIRIEHQILEVLSLQLAYSLPLTHSPAFARTSHLFLCPNAMQVLDCGGCPWGQVSIKSMPMRSSARQRTRSSRRPCRPHRSSRRGYRPWRVRSSLMVYQCGKGRCASRRRHPRRTWRSPPFPMRRYRVRPRSR